MRKAQAIADHLLEYGKIDYGVDAQGRTRWNVATEKPNYDCYWVTPEAVVLKVPAHVAWARQMVLKDPKAEGVLSKMKALGYVRSTVDREVFYCNTNDLTPKQTAAVDRFIQANNLSLQHAVIA
jgi:hypothetical protein